MGKIKSSFVLVSLASLIALFYYMFLNYSINKKELDEDIFYKVADSLGHSVEGLDIWDISTITSEIFNHSLKVNNIKSEFIFLIAIDSINCMTCYDFHSEYWAEIVKKIPTLVYTKSLFKFVKSGNKYANFFELKTKKQMQINQKNRNFLCLLLSRDGRILYSDISELKNFKRSEMFYSVINRQIK